MTNDKIIRAFPSKEVPDCPVSFDDRHHSFCEHPAINLNTHDRLITCSKCGATLDPFAYLVSEAIAIRRGWDRYRQVQHMIAERQQQLADLDREKKRLQGQVRRLSLRSQT
jgi:hypothetical protein